MPKRKRKKGDWLKRLESTLRLGDFIRYDKCWDYVSDLEALLGEIADLSDHEDGELAVELLELFLSGCYEKMEEIDDSGGNMGMFFSDVFSAWICARQAADSNPEETIEQILTWMKTDNYGLCYNIETVVTTALDRKGRGLFRGHFENTFEEAYKTSDLDGPCRIHDYPHQVRKAYDVLRKIYVVQKATKAYLDLFTRIDPSPKDCENLAEMLVAKRKPEEALNWVKRGMKLAKQGRWPNESAFGLSRRYEELLNKLGRSDEALASAWESFSRSGTAISYDRLMEFVPKTEKPEWHAKALAVAKKANLSEFLKICTATNELEQMARKVEATKHQALEGVSHYFSEPAADSLAKAYPAAAAKLYHAMGIRILASRKSKYYPAAIDHFTRCREIYLKIGKERSWTALVAGIRKQHSRKSAFIGDFEDLVAGKQPESEESFSTKMKRRWREQAES